MSGTATHRTQSLPTAPSAQAHTWAQVPIPADVARLCERGTKMFVSPTTKCKVLLSHTAVVGWHISISHPWRDPTWDEIKSARYGLVADHVRMTMDLPPLSEFVNVHEHCFHLYECRCAAESR